MRWVGHCDSHINVDKRKTLIHDLEGALNDA